MTAVLFVGTGFKFNEVIPFSTEVSGSDITSMQPCCNCFWGFVYAQDMWPRRTYHPLQDGMVELYYRLPSSDSLIDTRETSHQGMYAFCNHPLPGTYIIKIRCDKTTVERVAPGNIRVDFYLPDPYPCPDTAVINIPES